MIRECVYAIARGNSPILDVCTKLAPLTRTLGTLVELHQALMNALVRFLAPFL